VPHSSSETGNKTPKRFTSRDLALAVPAGRQFGLVSLVQLLSLGFTRDDIRTRVARGQLHKIYPGVYAVGHVNLIPHARLLAALMTCGPNAFLSHRASASVRGLRPINTKLIDVTVPGSNLKPRERLVLHRGRPPHEAEVTTYNDLRVSSVPRMLIELSAHETLRELDRLITEAVRRRLLDLAAMEEALSRHAREPGVGKLKQALRDYRPRPEDKSGLERAFAQLIAGTDVPPPLRNVIVAGWELDFYWPHAKLVVELDGRPYHIAVRDIERDKLKDGKLLLLGINTLRVTDLRMTLEPEAVLRDVSSLTT
jgi:very-short-patch-repair endonuclease